MNKKTIMIILLIVTMFLPVLSFAVWQEPQEVLSGTWGSGIGQFHLAHLDTGDFGPDTFGVDVNGVIVIPDFGNHRIAIYNPDGKLRNILYKPSAMPNDSINDWPSGFTLYPGGNVFVVNCEYQKTASGRKPTKVCFFDYNGNILAKVDSAEVFSYEAGFVLLNYKNNSYSLYTPTGQLIKTAVSKPSELGIVKQKYIGSEKYSISITYPDKSWVIVSSSGYGEPNIRDFNKNLYLYGAGQAVRYSSCGKEISSLTIPSNNIVVKPLEEGTEEVVILEAYGEEVIIAPNGDAYTWKQTQDKYSIVKWTWVDEPGGDYGPDAPTGLTVTPSTTGLYLAWKPSLQDPGCVTGYELSRSTSAGGVYSVLTTVDKGIGNYNDTTALEGTTYFYKIRAKSGNDFSPYTPEASAKR